MKVIHYLLSLWRALLALFIKGKEQPKCETILPVHAAHYDAEELRAKRDENKAHLPFSHFRTRPSHNNRSEFNSRGKHTRGSRRQVIALKNGTFKAIYHEQ